MMRLSVSVSSAAVTSSRRLGTAKDGSAPGTAGNRSGTTTIDMMWRSIVRCVERCFGRINTGLPLSHVPVSVVRVTENGSSVVYNLHVDGPHEFYAGGVLVHNCVWGISELFPRVTKRKVDENWKPKPALTVARSASRFDARQHRR